MPGSPAALNSSKAQKCKSLLSLAVPRPIAQGEQDEAGKDLPKAPAKGMLLSWLLWSPHTASLMTFSRHAGPLDAATQSTAVVHQPETRSSKKNNTTDAHHPETRSSKKNMPGIQRSQVKNSQQVAKPEKRK